MAATARTVPAGSLPNASRTEYISSPTGMAFASGSLCASGTRKAHGSIAPVVTNFRRVHILESSSLVFVQIFAGDVVLGDFVGVNFAFVGVAGVFDAFYHFGFE